MKLSRRSFFGATLASGLSPFGARQAMAQEAEPFPVKLSELKDVDYKFRRREMEFDASVPAGTIMVDPRMCFLFLSQGNGTAIRYGVSVGKSTHAWSGEAVIKKMTKWPVWTPAPYHIAVKPALAKFLPNGMPGGPGNPLGARALYLFKGEVDTINRIHGAAKPTEIGRKATAGCIGMLNADVVDLYNRVQLGTRVVMMA